MDLKKLRGLMALTVVIFLFLSLAGSIEFSDATGNRTVSVDRVYFPGDEVVIKANFKPNQSILVNPAGTGREVNFENDEGQFMAKIELKKDVVLGKYLLMVDNVTAEFYVDSYSIEAAYSDGKVAGNVSYYFVKPDYVYYKAGEEEGRVEVAEDGSFEIRLEEPVEEVELSCGNAAEKVNLTMELRIVVDRVVVVDETAFVEGRVLLNGAETEANLSYWFDEGEEKVLEVNGSFNLSFSNVSGILHLKAEKYGLRAEQSVEIEAVKKVVEVGEVYFAGDTVVITTNFKPGEGLVVGPEGKKETLEFFKEGERYRATYELKKDVVLGNYTVVVDGAVKQFVVDFCEVSAEFRDGAIRGEARSFYTPPKVRYLIAGENFSEEGVVGANFSIPINRTGDYRAVFECGNSRLEINFSVAEARNVEVDDFSFLGEIVEVRATFMPQDAYIFTPSSETVRLNFSEREGAFVAEIRAEEIGRYNVRVDEFNLSFLVDDYSINARFNGSAVVGTIKWHFVEPEEVCYEAGDIEGCVGVENGQFSLEIPGNVTSVKLKCGNAELTLTLARSKEIEVNDSYFAGDVVVVKANFEPEESYLVFNNESMEISFEQRNGSWVYEFKAERVGVYRVVADGVERSFVVDSCQIDAKIADGKVLGEVKTNFTEISSISYTLEPLNQSGFVNVEKGKFEVEVPENTSEIVLFCGNSALRLRNEAVSDFRVVEFDGLAVNITIDKGRFERLDVEGDEVNLTISGLSAGEKVNVEVGLPFEIPEGMHIYYWKEVDGRIIPVNYAIATDRKTIVFSLQDGVVDEDGKADGVIVDPLKFYIPRFKVERELSGKSGILHVFDLNGTKLYDVKVEVDRGNLSYLAFVDEKNLPSKPNKFPYQLIKFSVGELNPGEEVTVRVTYPSLEGVVTDNGARYYKFNPYTLNWSEFYAEVESNTVVLKLKDGGFGDDDGKANGVLEDDGGVGWAGYGGEWSASICRGGKTDEVHTYWVYVPSGDSFQVGIYDPDSSSSDGKLDVLIYYPNGTLEGTYNLTSNMEWEYITILTNGATGWWTMQLKEDDWPWDNGNFYGMNITGTDAINIRVNENWSINGEQFYGTPDAVMVDYNNNNIAGRIEFWVYAENDFKVAINDSDGALTLHVISPDGTTYDYNTSGDNWIQNIDISEKGWYGLIVEASRNYDDYSSIDGNMFRIGVNIPDGLYFKPVVTINGRILEDFYPLGVNNGEDRGIPNARVVLFEDVNGNGLIDSADTIRQVKTTDNSGYYSFDITKTGDNFIVAVDSKSLTPTKGLNQGHAQSETWAEQTYQTEWDGSKWVVVQKFGGQNPEESDVFGLNFEHYTALNLNNYNGESIDFGFSFEVIVNTEDKKDEGLKPIGEVFIVKNVGESWKTVYLHNYYESPVIVCTYNLPSSSDPPAVVRIRNVQHYSFEIKIQNPGDRNTPTPSDVHCIVMEEGNWTLSDGRKVEAHRVLSDGTNENNDWDAGLMEQLSYNWSYDNPVVLGQVMSYNDPNWSVFWTCNGNRQNPPDSTNLYVGKHVGEDEVTTRNLEVLGVIVVEAGSGVVNGISYEANLGGRSIRGVGNNPPYQYNLGGTYSIAIATQNAMRNGDGGWAVLYGSNPVSNTLNLAIDEDQIGDYEIKNNQREQVAYWVFNKSGTLTAKVESERYCQGCLRQFIANSNAIAGKQRSYFVMAVPPNSNDAGGKWWTITANTSLGPLPAFSDEVELNGTVLNPDLTLNNSNPDCLLYNYSTNSLESVACDKSIPVGVGSDGVPFSGDEPRLNAIPKPEIEIVGVAGSPVLNFNDKAHVSSVSVFSGSNGIEIREDDSQLDKVFAGLRADGSDPLNSGFSRISSHGIRILSNNTTVASSIAAFNGLLGIRFEGSGVQFGKASTSIAFYNALNSPNFDGFIAVGGASNVIFENCVAANNSGSGIDNYNGGRITIRNCSVVKNGWGNAEPSGIRVSGSGSEIVNNLVAENVGDGILVTPTGSTGTPKSIKISSNSIFKNGYVGIDLNVADTSNNRGDNVTLNDGQLNCSQPNCGVDYPVITMTYLSGSLLRIEGFINDENANSGSPSFAGATVEIYMVNNSTDGDDLVGNNVLSGGSTSSKFYGEGWIYLGSLTADSSGNFRGDLNVAGKGVEVGSLITALTILNGNTSEFGPDARVTTKPVKVKAEMAVTSSGANITITALEDANNVKIYWIKPSSLVLTAEGDFDSSGNDGNIYWWEFSSISAGEVRHVNLTFDGDFSLIETFNIGVDPKWP